MEQKKSRNYSSQQNMKKQTILDACRLHWRNVKNQAMWKFHIDETLKEIKLQECPTGIPEEIAAIIADYSQLDIWKHDMERMIFPWVNCGYHEEHRYPKAGRLFAECVSHAVRNRRCNLVFHRYDSLGVSVLRIYPTLRRSIRCIIRIDGKIFEEHHCDRDGRILRSFSQLNTRRDLFDRKRLFPVY